MAIKYSVPTYQETFHTIFTLVITHVQKTVLILNINTKWFFITKFDIQFAVENFRFFHINPSKRLITHEVMLYTGI